MTDGARAAIFAAIHKSLGPLDETRPEAIRREAARLLDHPETVRPRLPDEDDVALFLEAVTRLPPGASAERVGSFEALPAKVAERLASVGLPPLVKIQPTPRLAELDWSGAGLALSEVADEGVAVTLAERGVAETASLLVRSGPDSAILDAILPLHHIAVLRQGDIVRHLDEAFGPEDLRRSRNLMLVTGPSGTTDIEGNLVIGVHGPRTLHILIVGD